MSKYPYTAWRLLPSFKPVSVKIVAPVETYWRHLRLHKRDDKGKAHAPDSLFPSRAAALQAAIVRAEAQQTKLDKMQAKLNKKWDAIREAEKAPDA